MNGMPRTAPLARVKTLSISALVDRQNDPEGLQNFINALKAGDAASIDSLFVDVGLARSLRIDEDWGTTTLPAIGNATRPAIVPNNYTANVSIERLFMDGRSVFSYVTSPDYWYSTHTHRVVGNRDWLLYTYLVVDSKENAPGTTNKEIYAVMPKSSSVNYASSDVIIAHSVQMVGFKYTYVDLINLITKDGGGLLNRGRTAVSTSGGAVSNKLGEVVTPNGK